MTHSPSPKALIPLILNKPSLPPVLPLPSLHHQPNQPHDRLPGPHTLQPMHPQYHYVLPHQVPRGALMPEVPVPQEFAYYQAPQPQGYMVPAPVVPMLAPVPYPVYPVMNNQSTQHSQHHQHPHTNPPTQHPHTNPPPPQKHRRFRRRYYQIVRKYKCTYPGCTKRYGLLNHLNTHIVTKKHGLRKSKADFKDVDLDEKEKTPTPPLAPLLLALVPEPAPEPAPQVPQGLLPTPPVCSLTVSENTEKKEEPESKTLPRILDILDGPVKLPLLPSVVGYQK
ncbi:hypothetical protein C7M61_003263 [Candidozyma pseudohaemuli]|uniref:C2H2-type domain-containing protein n=1 Tax=Candidozyma pseudohaemuli TaxID=418784 RepID=A0A2P7YNM3_9ASCO|nr:hypothetical protein C7M61_003263 [[Candida] pseudohaemulonii]PSK37559.1 hypothetical protein C7M61_003263 [[Candida] pseudohaemulonii]